MIAKPHRGRVFLLSLFFLSHALMAQVNEVWFSQTTIVTANGERLDETVIKGPPEPPPGCDRPVWKPSGHGPTRGELILACVPAFNWSFGCSATAAAMMAAYYDITGRPDIYSGPTNSGVMPLNNSCWPDIIINNETRHQCPLSATRDGLDGRSVYGHVDDYWYAYGSPGPDPWVMGGWTEHTYGDCTGDYMFTNQWDSVLNRNNDGGTTFYFYPSGAKMRWYTLGSLPDGGAGIRSFMMSRGYTVGDEYNQYIVEYGKTFGFSYDDYKNQIDNGRPVIIHLQGHSMLGLGYDDTESDKILIHDTWDYSDHWMTWGGYYSGMLHYAVTVIELDDFINEELTIKNTTVGSGKAISFVATDTIQGSTGSGSDYLEVDGTCTMTAGTIIYLRDGFHADEGCEFNAIIGSVSAPGQGHIPAYHNEDIIIPDQMESSVRESDDDPMSMTVYPNPNHGRFTVLLKGHRQEFFSLTVTDAFGTLVYRQECFPEQHIVVDISRLPRGVYMVQMVNRYGMISEKVIRQ
jgi:hypothetical protein